MKMEQENGTERIKKRSWFQLRVPERAEPKLDELYAILDLYRAYHRLPTNFEAVVHMAEAAKATLPK